MTFVQLMEYTTSTPDEVDRITEEWERATRGTRTATRVVTLKHHDQADRYYEMVFFDSHDAAMENSRLPETQEFAKKHQQLVEGEVSYLDLDVVDDKEL